MLRSALMIDGESVHHQPYKKEAALHSFQRTRNYICQGIKIMNDHIEIEEHADGIADAVAAVALVAIFVVSCIFWISGQ